MNSPLLRAPRHWIVWTIALFAVTFALGFAAKALPALRFASLDGAVNAVNGPVLDQVALLADTLDQPLTVGVILVAVFAVSLLVRGWRIALGVCVVTALGWLTTLGVKALVAQPRPTGELLHALSVHPATLSYPSGHVVFVVALVAALAMACRGGTARAATIAVGAVAILVVAWARLYVGVHDLPDVIGAVPNGVAGAVLFAGLWNLVAARVLTRSRPA